MSNSFDRIDTVCSKCGIEGEVSIGRLKQGFDHSRGFICSNETCHAPANYTPEQLERALQDKRAGIIRKFRIN